MKVALAENSKTGVFYNGIVYAASGENVELELSSNIAPTDPTFKGYTASAGTFDGNTLTMLDEDVTVSEEFARTEITIKSVDINGIITSTTVYAETYTTADYTVPSAPYLDGYDFAGWKVNGKLCTVQYAI
ncbi:hypothetical protein SAMN02910447_00298 [Ruminococcus sp. YE71]|uniref:hypothetical protein n=1 Tax=unclassified Ruminococcus TaxID=2608920 RepID=UPI00088E0205|nr:MULTISPECIES: hypothetical protein [unclassified Ruminococcus]SDA09325.1 hypothetical protein SAMN02910446_00051 [Ruminococcus sp. YE78]SFW12606.1 hypothetical protein SAMN02910447_00298 [Ruminococcus sp. YE71]